MCGSSWGRTMGCLGLLKESMIAMWAMGCDLVSELETSAHLGLLLRAWGLVG